MSSVLTAAASVVHKQPTKTRAIISCPMMLQVFPTCVSRNSRAHQRTHANMLPQLPSPLPSRLGDRIRDTKLSSMTKALSRCHRTCACSCCGKNAWIKQAEFVFEGECLACCGNPFLHQESTHLGPPSTCCCPAAARYAHDVDCVLQDTGRRSNAPS